MKVMATKKHKHEWRKHYSSQKPYKYSHSRCNCGATKTEDIKGGKK